ncbi:MAG: hypothetical protein IJF57_05410 [Clostridia bacterium]|nr:hypothetical protein [Clostridia bacterium]
MKSKLTAIISAILAACVLFASGCGTKPEENKPENETTVRTAASTVSQTAEAVKDEETTVPAQSSNLQTAPAETTLEAETTAPAAPASTQEIVALFNESANRIKPEASKVVKNYEKRIVNEDKLVIPELLESTAKSLMTTLMKDDTDPIVYDTKEDIRNEFLVPDQSYVSRLKADAVEKATCTDNGKEYVVYLKLKNQENPTAGSGVGAVCDVIEAAEVAEGAPFIEKFTTKYYNCEVKATIDKASGRVTHISYSTPLVLEATVNMFGTHDAAVGLTFVKDYTITY